MNKKIVLAVLLFILAPIVRVMAQFPQADISNKLITAKLYLPDAEKGYYRAMRFDWAGVIYSLNYKGHEFFGQWFDKHDPLINDAITGPVEGFLPVGYDIAEPGETFLMVGVGMVKKADTRPWSFSRNYEIVNGGTWSYKVKKDRIEFTQELKDETGYAYIYKKTVLLEKGIPVLVLNHTLKNTGLKPIETNVFNHNFLMIDHQPTGPDFTVKVPFKLVADMKPKDMISFKDNSIVFNRPLKKGEDAFTHLTGFGIAPGDYDIMVANATTGSSVRITSDQPIASMGFWTIMTTISPEPYIKVQALPGKEFSWTINYEFGAK